MKINVPISKTILLGSEVQSVLEPLNSGWLVQGPKVAEFEKNGLTLRAQIILSR